VHSTMIWVEKVAAASAKSTRSETAFSTQNPLISLPKFALKMVKDVGND